MSFVESITITNHPKPGAAIKVYPIRDLKAVRRIKKRLAVSPRDGCLFTLGINTAYRANELLSLKVGQVNYLEAGDTLDIKQSKNKKYRSTALNRTVITAIDTWLAVHPLADQEDAPLFLSRKGGALTVSSLNRLVKSWCADVGLRENYGSHTLRKTWGYHQLRQANAPIPLLMEAYGHATQRQTLEYLCIQSEEILQLYTGLEL